MPAGKDRGRILNGALLKAVRPTEAKAPVAPTLTTEDGDELEVVGDGEVPEILPPEGGAPQ